MVPSPPLKAEKQTNKNIVRTLAFIISYIARLFFYFTDWLRQEPEVFEKKQKRHLDTYLATVNQRRVRKAQRHAVGADYRFACA